MIQAAKGCSFEADQEEAGKSHVDFLCNARPPREQAFLQTTKRKSKPSLQRAMTSTDERISFIDAFVGRLVDQLGALGLLAITLVIFTSDHGELLASVL